MANFEPSLAIIGVSGYGRILLHSVLKVLERRAGRMVAAVVEDEGEAREECGMLRRRGCRIFHDYREMFEVCQGSLDLCLIPTSIHWHARMSIDALEAGAHVLVEKPLAGSVFEARRVIDAVRRYERMVSVGFQDLYSPVTREIQSFLGSGRLGPVKRVRSFGSWPRSLPYYARNSWAGREIVDGYPVRDSPINNAFAHFLNLALYFSESKTGESAVISDCEGILLRSFPIESFDSAAVRLWTKSGVAVECVFTHADDALVDPEILVEMERGRLHWFFERHAVAMDAEGSVVARWTLPSAEESRQDMIGNLLDGVERGVRSWCPAELALSHVAAVERICEKLAIQEVGIRKLDWTLRKGLLAELLRGISEGCEPKDQYLESVEAPLPGSLEPFGADGRR